MNRIHPDENTTQWNAGHVQLSINTVRLLNDTVPWKVHHLNTKWPHTLLARQSVHWKPRVGSKTLIYKSRIFVRTISCLAFAKNKPQLKHMLALFYHKGTWHLLNDTHATFLCKVFWVGKSVYFSFKAFALPYYDTVHTNLRGGLFTKTWKAKNIVAFASVWTPLFKYGTPARANFEAL